MHDLERHGQPLLQQEANLTYQIGQAKDRLTELQEELAKVRGKLELLREMAEEMQMQPPSVRNRHNHAPNGTEGGVAVETPEEEEA